MTGRGPALQTRGDKGSPATYDPSMDRSSPSAAESAAEVTAALAPRVDEMAADIYRLIVREIPHLHNDKRMLTLLDASVAENVATVLHILQHGIDLEKVHAPAAAEEYARRLAQRGVPVAALLRAYRIGSARFEDWCLQELGRRSDDAAVISAAGLRIARILAAYIDQVSEELVSAYESEKENWLRNQSVARAARVRALLKGEQVDVSSSEAVLGYRLRQHHLGVVTWITEASAGGDALGLLERATAEMAAEGHCDGRPMFVPQDEFCAWAWIPLGAQRDIDLPTMSSTGGDRIRFAFGEPAPGRGGFPPHSSAGAERPGSCAGGRTVGPDRDQLRPGRAAGPDVRLDRAAAGVGHRDLGGAGGRRRPQRPAARHAAGLPPGKRQLQIHGRTSCCCTRTRSSTGSARPRRAFGIPSPRTACTLN